MLQRCQNDLTVKPDVGLNIYRFQIRLAEEKIQKLGVSRNRIFLDNVLYSSFQCRGGRSSGSTSDYWSRGPYFDSLWELSFYLFPFPSLNQWCVLNQVPRGGDYCLLVLEKHGGLGVQLDAKQAQYAKRSPGQDFPTDPNKPTWKNFPRLTNSMMMALILMTLLRKICRLNFSIVKRYLSSFGFRVRTAARKELQTLK